MANESSVTVWVTMTVALGIAFAYVALQGKGRTRITLKNTDPRNWLRLLKSTGDESDVQVRKQVMLTQRSSLHVISWRGEELLVACSDYSTTVLAKHKLDGLSHENGELQIKPRDAMAAGASVTGEAL